ncbi:hypothetical protein ACFU6S_37880 [Streptomyces sp. NPDC057456]|uniref:hypothetical protein n=1 Tax=Streptomyces sp. NPDC057456 TaxID=3346139 RepID=UPI0036C650BE
MRVVNTDPTDPACPTDSIGPGDPTGPADPTGRAGPTGPIDLAVDTMTAVLLLAAERTS